MSDKFYNYLEKAYWFLFYFVLGLLFLKPELLKINAGLFSLSLTSVKNIAPILIVVWAVLRMRDKLIVSKWFLLVFGVWLLSLVVSENTAKTFYAGITLLAYFLWFYAVAYALKDKSIGYKIFLMLVLIAGVVNIVNLLCHLNAGIGTIMERYYFWRGKNAFGLFLVFALCFSGCVSFGEKWNLLLGFNFIMLSVGLAFNYSRSAWVAGIAALAGIVIFRAKKALTAIVILAAVFIVSSPKFISDRFNRIYSGEDENVKQRLVVWENTVKMIKEKPLFGTGLGTFTKSYIKRFPEGMEGREEGTRVIRHAHNLYLQILSETGLVGLLLFFIMIVFGFIRGVKNFIKDKDEITRQIRYAGLVGIIAFLFYSLTDCTVSWQFMRDSFSHINLIWVILWTVVLKRGWEK